jgi:hypothetical protein
MTTQVKEYDRGNPEHRQLAFEILDALKGIQYGAVEIVVHDGRVTQIDRKERFRFPLEPKG